MKEVKKKDAGDDGEGESEQDESPLMNPAEAKEHRGVAARMNYMTVDRADCQYATKELARTMANPTVKDAEKGT